METARPLSRTRWLALAVVVVACKASLPECVQRGDPGCPMTGAPRTLVPIAGRFTVHRALFGGREQASALWDCNDDGRLDIYAGGPVMIQATDGSFAPGGESSALPNARAVVFVDVDGDGLEDIVTGTDTVEVSRGLGACRFERPHTIAPARPGRVAQLIAADVDQDGLTDIGVSQAGSTEAPFRVLLARGDGSFDERVPAQDPSSGNRDAGFRSFVPFFEDGDGVRDFFGLVDSGNSWFSWGVPGGSLQFARDDLRADDLSERDPMGLSALDFDRDGRMDYWISGTPESSRLWRNAGGRQVFDAEQFAGVAGEPYLVDWASYAFDANLDGWMDLLVLRRIGLDEPPLPAAPRLLINLHDGTFSDQGAQVVGAQFQARSMTCGDLASDGRVSCFLFDYDGVTLLENHLGAEGGWAGARLRGTVSDREAQGARIRVDDESPARVVAVGGQVGVEGSHAPGVLLATGGRAALPVTVTWPSGVVQHASLASQRYTDLVEPEVFTLSARALPADGQSTAEFALAPALGNAGAATVEGSGDGGWVGPARSGDDGRLHRTWRAPAAAGRTRFTVTLDGVALAVHPVLRFR